MATQNNSKSTSSQQTSSSKKRSTSRKSDNRKDFDPAVADQLSTMIISTSQHNLQVNTAAARNQVAASANVLTLGVQQVNSATLNHITTLSPQSAGAAANLRSSQDSRYMGGLNTGSGVPGAGQPRPTQQ